RGPLPPASLRGTKRRTLSPTKWGKAGGRGPGGEKLCPPRSGGRREVGGRGARSFVPHEAGEGPCPAQRQRSRGGRGQVLRRALPDPCGVAPYPALIDLPPPPPAGALPPRFAPGDKGWRVPMSSFNWLPEEQLQVVAEVSQLGPHAGGVVEGAHEEEAALHHREDVVGQ